MVSPQHVCKQKKINYGEEKQMMQQIKEKGENRSRPRVEDFILERRESHFRIGEK